MNTYSVQLRFRTVLFWSREIENAENQRLAKAYAVRMREELDELFCELFGEAAAEFPKPVAKEGAA